jgi:hypothetical protein
MSGNTKSASKPNGLRDESDAIASAATPAFHGPELAGVVSSCAAQVATGIAPWLKEMTDAERAACVR